MERWDAIVVGAGPAGSTTAFRLAQAGASVLLVDRARFPRDKPCGGGVTGRALRALPFAIDPVVERVVTRVELGLAYRRRVVLGSGEPIAVMTQRARLDHYLTEEAARAGADFRDGVKVTAVEAEDARVVVSAGGERVAARVVVGADGVNGVVARALALGGNRSVGVALEGNVPWERLDGERYPDRIVLELGTVPGGYAWVFPKGEHANVGVGGWASEGRRLRAHLARLCAVHSIPLDGVDAPRGYRLPLRAPDSTLARGPALLVGDAAGLVDPLSGDGMFEAFVSARYAAAAVLDVLAGREPGLDPYGPRLSRRLAAHLWASWTFRAALDRFPRSAFTLAGSGPVWNVIERLVRGDLGDFAAAGGVARAPLTALALLGRAAGDPGRAYREA